LVGRFDLPDKMTFGGFSGSGLDVLAYTQETVAPVRIQPVMGGPARQLTEARAYDRPLGWVAGGEEIFFGTQLNGQDIYMLAPIRGGAIRQAPVPSGVYEYPRISGDGTHIAYIKDEENSQSTVLTIVSLESGESREVSRSIWRGSQNIPALTDPEAFLFVEQTGNQLELKSVVPERSPRLMWSFPAGEFPEGLAVTGNRVVYTDPDGDSTIVYLAERGSARARRLFAREGRIALNGMWNPVWSPSGKLLEMPYMPAGSSRTDVIIAEFDASGSLIGEPRVSRLGRGPKWWYATQWLPDESGFLALGLGAEAILDTDIWLFSLEPGIDPVPLTDDDPRSVWNFTLSPDGKYVAYSSEMPMGGSIWKIELPGFSGAR
jgi:hypothetical protein